MTERRVAVARRPDSDGSRSDLGALLDAVMQVPRKWTAAMVALAVVSSVELSRPADGDIVLHVAVGPIAVAALALIWLPALLRLLSLTGGHLKAAGVEASAGGLLGTSEELVRQLADIRAEAERVEQRAPQAGEIARDMRAAVDRLALDHLDRSALRDDALDRLARLYEHARATLAPGDDRTRTMTKIVNEARLRAQAAPADAGRRGAQLVRSAAPGDRIVGLALLQESPAAAAYGDLIHLIEGSATAFELYHALLALEQLAPQLPLSQRTAAAAVLTAEQNDPRGVGVMDDAALPHVIARVLSTLHVEWTPHAHG